MSSAVMILIKVTNVNNVQSSDDIDSSDDCKQ